MMKDCIGFGEYKRVNFSLCYYFFIYNIFSSRGVCVSHELLK